MPLLLRTIATWVFIALSPCVFGENDSYRTKLGVDLKGYKTPLDYNVGALMGLRYSRYVGASQVHIGGAGYYGIPTGRNPSSEYVSYGGLTLNYDGRMSKTFIYELGLLVGMGQGEFRNTSPIVSEKSYLIAEPSASMGFALGLGWRLTFSASYIYMTEARSFTGYCFGFRLDYKTSTGIKSYAD